ncbi:MAG: hypothetical protein JOY70_11270 [Acidisphaera sp.]|nr:hypothetical protein [Acidisphaera sp.]
MAQTACCLRMVELLAMRLCHDLAGPLGTVGAALALAEEDEASVAEACALAAEAAQVTVGRLRMLQAAWGEPAPRTRRELRNLTAALARKGLLLEMPADDTVMPAALARLLLNAVMLAAASLPRGGRVTVSEVADGGFLLEIAGPQAAWPPHLGRYLADAADAQAAFDDEEEGQPRAMLAPLTALFAHQARLRLTLLLPATGDAPPPLLLAPDTP